MNYAKAVGSKCEKKQTTTDIKQTATTTDTKQTVINNTLPVKIRSKPRTYQIRSDNPYGAYAGLTFFDNFKEAVAACRYERSVWKISYGYKGKHYRWRPKYKNDIWPNSEKVLKAMSPAYKAAKESNNNAIFWINQSVLPEFDQKRYDFVCKIVHNQPDFYGLNKISSGEKENINMHSLTRLLAKTGNFDEPDELLMPMSIIEILTDREFNNLAHFMDTSEKYVE